MHIKFVDIQRQYQRYKNELRFAMEEVMEQGDFILGNAVNKFEQEFACYIGCTYAIGVDSGTSALELSVKALEIEKGDEVITVPNTFISTAFSISDAGAKVVFVDVDKKTQLMDTKKLINAITQKTKAVIPVHLFGHMVNMDAICKIAEQYNLKIIEDACQAHGAMQYRKKAGSLGDLACFSFYPGKNLGAYGDGGMITTSNKELYEKLILLRNYGSSTKYHHQFKGNNARLDSLQAAVLSVKLKYLDQWNTRRKTIADKYLKGLKNIGDIILPYFKANNYSCYHLFVIRTKKRDDLIAYLNNKQIQVQIHYPIPIHLQPAYSELNYINGNFPIAEKLSKEILSLPIHPEMIDEEVNYVINNIKYFFSK